jgi:hypothetical protein
MKRKIIGTAIVLTLITGGSLMAVNQPSEETRQIPVTIESKVTPWPAKPATETPVAEQPSTPPVTPPEPVEAPQVPPPDTKCVGDKNTALAPLQAQLNEYDGLIAKRTVELTELYNARKSVNAIPEWVTLEYWLEDYLSRTLRPAKDRIQVQYNTLASQYDC